MVEYQPTSHRPIAQMFRRTGRAATNLCVRLGIPPDAISYLSILAALAAALCFWKSGRNAWLLIIAPLFCYLRLWLHMLDGMVAVAAGEASARGEIVHGLPERISDVSIFVGRAHSAALTAVIAGWAGTLSWFARAWWRDSRFSSLGIKDGAGLDLEDLSFVAGDGVDRSIGGFRRTRPGHCWGDIAFDSWVQGIRPLFRIVSRLVDDWRRLRRHRCSRDCILGTGSARRRARCRLVWLFHGRAGFRYRVDPAHSDPAQPRPGRTAKDVVEHHWLYLHRLDVRTSGLSGEHD